MRNLKVIIPALLLTAALGGTAFAADSPTAPQTTTSGKKAPVKHHKAMPAPEKPAH
jgi:hypothetical protein